MCRRYNTIVKCSICKEKGLMRALMSGSYLKNNIWRFVWAISIFFVFALLTSISLADITVTVNPWGDPNITTFPPDKPPTNPPLPPDANADERPFITDSNSFTYGWDGNELEINDVTVTISGHTEIREPTNCDPNVHEHELGHDELNEDEYNKRAKDKMEKALEGFDEMKFKGEGDTDEAREKDAKAKAEAELKRRINRALDSITTQMDVIGGKYDELTNSGKCDDPNCPDAATGVDQAKKERAKAPEAGSAPAKPKEDRAPPEPNEEGAYMPGKGPGTLCFYDDQQHLVFNKGEPILITSAGNPLDPIVGRGAVFVDPMILVGPQENGTILLSDTSLKIIDINNPGNILMKGFVFEVAYIPSRGPRSGSMIQGYLDIPPEWAGGISNTIDSNFLADMQAASEANEMTTFWFYPDRELFDKNGQCLISETDVDGILILGVGIPEYIVVDDMDDYNDTIPYRIYYTWRDGWDVNAALPGNDTGSQIGHWNGTGTGFSESVIVRSGLSMPFYYENDGNTMSKPLPQFPNPDNPLKYYSESSAKTTGQNSLNITQDWTIQNVKSLSLWFYGNLNNATGPNERMYVALEDSSGHVKAVYYDIANGYDPNDVKEPNWHEWNIPLSAFDDMNPALDVNLANVHKIHIGFGIRGNTTTKGGKGVVYFDDIRLYPARCVPAFLQPDADLDNDCDVDYDDLKKMADKWLSTLCHMADLYEDGMVDFKDFAILVSDGWLEEPMLWPSD